MDDLYKDALEANSPLVRANCWEWYTSVVRTRMHNASRELVVFTRWHEEDLIGALAAREPVEELRAWSQLDTLPADRWLHLNFEALKTAPPRSRPRQPGEALWERQHGARCWRPSGGWTRCNSRRCIRGVRRREGCCTG
ncbi:MAG: hypothetical protein ACLRMJ_08365 [Alistipes finegoldii]